MELSELIKQIRESGDRIHPIARIRRKPSVRNSKPVSEGGRYKGSEKQRKAMLEADKRWKKTVEGSWRVTSIQYKKRKRLREAKGLTYGTWMITLPEWKALWSQAGMVVTSLGVKMLALSLRGLGPDRCQLRRIDEKGDWAIDNVIVLYKGQAIANGRKIHTEEDKGNEPGAEGSLC